MANEKHVAILRQGVEVWNDWRQSEPNIKPDLSSADLGKANLAEANLSYANLQEADLEAATLWRADLSEASLKRASLYRTNLCGVRFREADLERAYLSFCDLSGAYLWRANLEGADLKRANLYAANLCGSNLTKANLKAVQALDADFIGATLTGACIEDWNINGRTNLDKIVCDYIYLRDASDSLVGALKIIEKSLGYNSYCPDDPLILNKSERRPHGRNFKPGEFTKLYQKVLKTVDIVFLDGIDWTAFLVSFLELKAQTGSDEISIQSFENRNGAFIVRINVPPDTEKAVIERFVEEKYQLILQDKDKQILFLREDLIYNRQENTRLIRIIETMAEKEGSKYHFHQPQIGNFIDTAQSGSRQQSINHQHNYAPEQKQTLAEAAAEIQQLLKQLEQTNPIATEAQQIEHINDETTPKFKKRVVGALQATGEAAIDEFVLENKYLKVAKAAIKGWMKPE